MLPKGKYVNQAAQTMYKTKLELLPFKPFNSLSSELGNEHVGNNHIFNSKSLKRSTAVLKPRLMHAITRIEVRSNFFQYAKEEKYRT